MTKLLPPFVTKVGVFVDSDPWEIKAIMYDCRLDLAQLHGAEPPDAAEILEGRVIKAFKAGIDRPDPIWQKAPVRAVLVDSYSPKAAGGTGAIFDWQLFQEFRCLKLPLILAGGINAANVAQALRITRPDALDVASGVERCAGQKDVQKINNFMAEVKSFRFLPDEVSG
jgi:phosphoribosylanthranilate isomerase